MFQPGFELLSCTFLPEKKDVNFRSFPAPIPLFFFPIGLDCIKVRHYYATYLSVHVILEKMVIR